PASERTRGLGAYPAVGLKDARERAGEARKLVTRGIDPIEADRAARNAAKPIPTFGEIAERVIEDAVGKSVSAKAAISGNATSVTPIARTARSSHPRNYGGRRGRDAPHCLEGQARIRAQALSGDPALSSTGPASSCAMSTGSPCLTIRPAGMISRQWALKTPKELTKGNHPSLPRGQMPAF